MDDRNDRRRDRLSWAEVDKIRDKSKTRDRDPQHKQSSPAALNAQKSYRAALEKAFASGTLGELAKNLARPSSPQDSRPSGPPSSAAASPPVGTVQPVEPPAAETPAPLPAATFNPKDPDREQKQKLVAKIREAEGRDAITRAIDAYVAKYPKLPDDFEVLTKALGHKSDERVRLTLDHLDVLCNKDKPRRARTLAAQLRILEDTHGDPEIRTYAAKVRARL